MIVKDIVPTDFVNYKLPCMYIAFPYCSFKCERECGIKCCQNSSLARSPNIDISVEKVVEMYKKNSDLSKALVLCGMEPFDSFPDVVELVVKFREEFTDPIIIYTGYTEEESAAYVEALKNFTNIIVKFGRFIPDRPHRVDELLGVELASDNQYSKKIS